MKTTRIFIATFLLSAVVPIGVAPAQLKDLFKSARSAVESESPNKIAHFRIKGTVGETPNAMPTLFGGDPPVSLKSLLSRLKQARVDDEVVAIVIDVQHAALGLGQMEEIHEALKKFAAVDKPVYVHADSLQTLTYAVATGASHISLVPTGDLWLLGLRGESPYLRGTLDKIGCTPDFEQYEDFKTAAETITRTEPSDASKQMTKWLLDGIYDGLVKRIAASRGLSDQKVRELIDDGPYLAKEALEAGLIDSVQHRQDFIAELKKRYGSDVDIDTDYGDSEGIKAPDDFFGMMSFLMEMFNPSPKTYTEPSVAIVYVEGAIQTGVGKASPFGPPSGAFSTSIRKALDKAAGDESVKAVVLRINSPGGSALASEIILDATRRVAAKKPLIVSMGDVAGSGGYYVACAAETIFADASTITASIGVIGGKIVTTEMWHKIGVNWHTIQRGKMAAMMSTATPFNDEERKKLRHYMGSVYETFKGHVVSARGDRLKKPIEEIAGGRVFTGAQALELGLVDRIGGLEDAIKFAAERADIGNYEIRVIPDPPSIFDFFAPKDRDEGYTRMSMRAPLGLGHDPSIRAMLSTMAVIDPLRVRAFLQALTRVELIHREGVVTMMPQEWLIR
ncbi:MAG: signal peptide peptidase SppA [Planctomycetes bacterium]|nr:signal peptide peptidase SppA [Planctomycetota bacterium]